MCWSYEWRRFKVNIAEVVNNSKTSKSWANTAVFIVLNLIQRSDIIFEKPQAVGNLSNNEVLRTYFKYKFDK